MLLQAALKFYLDGPFFRQCDVGAGAPRGRGGAPPAFSSPCGWGTAMPVNRNVYTRTIADDAPTGLQFMLTSDSTTAAVAASAIWEAHTVGNAFYVSLDDERQSYTAAGNISR